MGAESEFSEIFIMLSKKLEFYFFTENHMKTVFYAKI